MNARLLMHLSGALVAALAFAAGSWLQKPSRTDAARHLSSDGLGRETSSNTGDARSAADEKATLPRLTPEQARDRIYEILRLGNTYDRCRSMCALIPSITAGNWRGVVEAFREQSRKEGRILYNGIDYHLVLERVGAVAGGDAMSLYTDLGNADSRQATFYIMTGWGEEDPQGASAWLRGLPGGMQSNLMGHLVVGMARNDPARALEFALLDVNYQKSGDLTPIIDEATQSAGFRAAEDLLDGIEWRTDISDAAKQRFFSTLAQRKSALNVADGKPLETLDWMDQYLGRPIMSAQAAAPLIKQTALSDPVKTLDWLQKSNDRLSESQRSMDYVITASVWEGNNPEQVAAWLTAHPDDPYHDAMAAGAARHAADPTEAQRLIGTVSDPLLRSQFEEAQKEKKAAIQRQAGAGS